jgi:hypothetical protein
VIPAVTFDPLSFWIGVISGIAFLVLLMLLGASRRG